MINKIKKVTDITVNIVAITALAVFLQPHALVLINTLAKHI